MVDDDLQCAGSAAPFHGPSVHLDRALICRSWLWCRRCLFTMSSHTQAITQVKWGGDGLIYSAARDCSINVWAAADGRLVRRCMHCVALDGQQAPDSLWCDHNALLLLHAA